MRRTRLIWQVFPALLAIAALSITALTWYATGFARRVYVEQRTADLESGARMAESQFSGLPDVMDPSRVESLCRELGAAGGMRLTVILPDGEVLCDSSNDPSRMENHADRAEVREAL